MIKKIQQLSITKQNLIFDFDKTIAQIEIDWSDWFIGAAEIFKKYEPNHTFGPGKDPHVYYNKLVLKHGESFAQEMKRFVSRYEQENTKSFTPYEDLISFLKRDLKNDLYLFSSNAKVTVETGLKSLGLQNTFEKLITRDDVIQVKPSSEGFYLIPELENNKEQFLMIGDSNSDEFAAKEANIDFLKCTYFGTYTFNDD
jgi:phosphoglycolate phosphatase/pyrophosphatase PpaX